MKYEGYKIGPVIRDIRKDKGLLIEEVIAGVSHIMMTTNLIVLSCCGQISAATSDV